MFGTRFRTVVTALRGRFQGGLVSIWTRSVLSSKLRLLFIINFQMPLSVSLTVATISLEMRGVGGGGKRLNDRGRLMIRTRSRLCTQARIPFPISVVDPWKKGVFTLVPSDNRARAPSVNMAP